jgi:hypothetical protein
MAITRHECGAPERPASMHQTMPLPITGRPALSVAEAKENRQDLPGCRRVQASSGSVLQNQRRELSLRGRRRFIQRPRG